jgi:outer membrane protein assembly factor BamB
MPTPLIHEGVLYVLANQGLLDAYDLRSGEEVYRQRIPHEGSGFSASPVLAGGRLYLSSEDGDIFVIRAGRTFEILGRHPMGEPLMATPALAGNTIYVRGERHLFAIGK